MSIAYNIIISSYLLLIKLHSVFNLKSRQWLEGRKNIFTKIKNEIKNDKNIVWFHCASLGEYEQAKELIFQFKKRNKLKKILLTFFSPSGYRNVNKEVFVDWIFYLPLDTKKNAERFIELIKPEMAFFIKSEFWFNYMIALDKKKIPLYHISSIFNKNQLILKFKFFPKMSKKI